MGRACCSSCAGESGPAGLLQCGVRGFAAILSLAALAGCAHADPPATSVTPEPQPVASTSEGDPPPAVLAPEQEGAPLADVDLDANSGAALIALADRITHVELRFGDETILRFDDAVRDQIVETLREAKLADSLSATSPPWPDYWVILHVEGRDEPFVASIISMGGLRINARDPYSLMIADDEGLPDFENIEDVGYSDLLYDAVAERVGPPQGKEYQKAPRPRPKGGKQPDPRDDSDLADPFG